MSQKIPKFLYINAILFLLAAGLSVYMTHLHYEIVSGDLGFGSSICKINGQIDCEQVIGSSYSEIAGIPLTTFSLGFYLLGITLSLIGARNAFARRDTLLLQLGLSGASVAVSVGYFIVSFFVLTKVCLFCGVLQTTNVVTFLLTALAWRAFAGGSSTGRELGQANAKRLAAYAGAGVVFLAASLGATAMLKIDHYPLPDAETYVNEFRASPVVKIDVGQSPKQGFQGDNPPLQLIEFADFQCPGCGWAAKFMHRLVPLYKDKVQLIFKNFPLNSGCNPFVHVEMHPQACVAAMAGYCAKKQGKFQEMYDQMFGHQEDLNRDSIEGWAKDMGLDMKAFDDCVLSNEARDAIIADEEQGQKAGLESTPTFFANGRMVKGAIDEARLKLLLREFGL